ncbi:cell death abnormality protein 1-like [Ischnura elegans]|uniref:cell death abnormality protein 1-like n=1 Tax=Ischnura elegans TaxID=197161 RepID=UPI001ED875B7|nr:cell death abnormality protein 1-like [Ischnura elegans]
MEILMKGIFFGILLALSPYLSQGTPIADLEVRTSDSKLGDPCNATTPCTGDTECDWSGFCNCKLEFTAAENLTCVDGNGAIGSICNNNVGCEYITDSQCSVPTGRGKCICPDGFFGPDGFQGCVADSPLGDSCNDSNSCSGNMVCNVSPGEGQCTCRAGLHLNDSLICIHGDAVVGSVCSKNLGCENVNNSMCSSADGKGKCVCTSFYHGKDGDNACVMNAKLGDACPNGNECTGNTECIGGFCTCKMGNSAGDDLVCKAGDETIGSTCKNNVGCEQVPNSQCSERTAKGKCTCKDGFHAAADRKSCAEGKR